ncbi:MAG: SMP-30/gluconolactonase/LRE family protein [Bacteroidota bacterium]
MEVFDSKLVLLTQTELGEGPLWHHQQGKIFTVDITQGNILAVDSDSRVLDVWSFPNYVSALAQIDDTNLLVAEKHEVSILNTSNGDRKVVAKLELDENVRFNECKCDRQGRFWLGTMHLEAKEGKGGFYRLDLNGQSNKILSDLTIPNGFCWSDDDRYLFHIDSFSHEVKKYEYHAVDGTLGSFETVYKNPNPSIYLDGMCMDRNGNLWIACWGGKQVICVDPITKAIIAQVKVPAPHVTSCAFGGKDFETLYITTAKLGLSDEQLERYPSSGGLFSCKVGVKGSNSFSSKILLA